MTRKKFAKLLKDYRERRGFTQEDAARHLGRRARAFEGFFQLGPDRVAALLGFFPLLAEDDGNILRR